MGQDLRDDGLLMRVCVCGSAVIASVDRLLVSVAGGLPALGELQQAVTRLCMRRAAPDHARAAAASAGGPPARGSASSRRPSYSALRYATGSGVQLVPSVGECTSSPFTKLALYRVCCFSSACRLLHNSLPGATGKRSK